MSGLDVQGWAIIGDIPSGTSLQMHANPPSGTKGEERRAFLLLAVVLFPVLSVAIVGGYGFLVWMYQIVAGPPTG